MAAPQTEVLITVDGVEHGRHVVEPGEYVLGCNPDCHIRVDADLVSRRHAKLTLNFDNALIEDLGSSNGTFVNNQPVAERIRIWPSQKIRIGAATITLRRLQGEAPTDMSLAPAQQTIRRMLPAEMLGERKYEIGAVVARGGMGAILDAREAAIERKVAMKVMLDTNDAGDIARFIAEAKVTGQLEHPNIVPVHELGVDENGQPFYTMKMVQGITLKKVLELLARGVEATVKKYPLPALLTVFQKVCDAVAFAHSKGIIHRDLKPENIMVGDYGEVLLMDWGLAKRIGEGGPPPPSGALLFTPQDTGVEKTIAGMVMGTPQYMAPEQARGEVDTLDARADIYALGAILFHLLALRPSVSGADAWAVVSKVGRGEVDWGTISAHTAKTANQPASKGDEAKLAHLPAGRVPESLAAVVRKAMALAPAQRYAGVPELQRDIEAFQGGFATSAENAGAWKHLVLFIRRNKAASIGVAAVLLIGGTLGTKALLEGRRAERALADLKRSAPSLLALGESEASVQRFDTALQQIDTALRLDPALAAGYWQRAWVLLGQQKWSEAAAALRLAQQRDPAGAKHASILPVVERFVTGPENGDAQLLIRHLQSVNTAGPLAALSRALGMTPEARLAIVKAKVQQWLGKDAKVAINISNGSIVVAFGDVAISDIEALRGLPIDHLNIGKSGVSSLEPLRGMPLTWLDINRTRITDLSPLAGMPLTSINLGFNKISDISPLRGVPLRVFTAPSVPDISDASPLAGAPLEDVMISGPKLTNLDFLRDAPIQKLRIDNAPVTDLSVLRGKPLKNLSIGGTAVRDLSPLADCPIETLNIGSLRPDADLTPLLNLTKLQTIDITSANNRKGLAVLRAHPSLKTINTGDKGLRQSVEEFWAEYDAKQAAGKK